jgi:acetate kinase
MNILVLNCGSSSLKYEILDTASGASLYCGKVEHLGDNHTHRQALETVLNGIQQLPLDGVGHRVLHGGEQFRQAHLIDVQTIDELRRLIPLARRSLPDLAHVAVFDTAFHATLPRRAKTYAIDQDVAIKLKIRRYGFHGSSHKYVAKMAAEHLESDLTDLRIISCHLGNGASVCAIEFGQSVETSMGMTPLEGLVMGTRSGDIDPAVVLELQRSGEMSVDEVDDFLNKNGGLKGLSGIGSDMRDLEARAADGDDRARLAITVFCHRVKNTLAHTQQLWVGSM